MQVMVDRPSFLLAIVDANMDVFLLVTTLCKIAQLQTVIIFCLKADTQDSIFSVSFWVLFSDSVPTSSWAVLLLVMRRLITIS